MVSSFITGPGVSVIIPYYNRVHTLKRALDSVGDQSDQDFEIIAVDDGSTDGSFALVEAYRQDRPWLKILNVHQHNSGPSAARNKGVSLATGRFIAFLDSDDSWNREKLSIQRAFMESHPDILITGTNYAVMLGDGGINVGYKQKTDVVMAVYQKMLFKVFFCMPTVMVRSQVFTDSQIWFRVGKNQGEDILFFLQVVKRHPGSRLKETLTYIHKEMYGKDGLSADLKNMLKNDIDNIRILRQEKDDQGQVLGASLAGLLVVYTLLKHFKRVIRTKMQH